MRGVAVSKDDATDCDLVRRPEKVLATCLTPASD
jgi:hypothetical protein